MEKLLDFLSLFDKKYWILEKTLRGKLFQILGLEAKVKKLSVLRIYIAS